MPSFAEPVRPPTQLKSEGVPSAFSRSAALDSAPTAAPAPLPARLRSGAEGLGGFSLAEVRVHRDSPEPAKLGALAFARGSEIHLGPGQERHLPHETWHVVQQKQGRVTAATQLKAIGINEDVALEAEADRLGSRAAGEVGSGPTAAHAVDGAALQLPEQVAGWDLSAKAKKARERVAKEAEKNKWDYRQAYLALRGDPTLWADYSGAFGANARRTFVYLPSYEADPWQLNLSVDFELSVEVGDYSPQAAKYPNISISYVVATIDKDSADSILKATISKNANVTIEAILWLDTFDGVDPPPGSAPETTVPLEPITIANVEDTNQNLIPSGTATVGPSGLESATLTFRLAGKITAAGTEWTPPLTVGVDAKDSKENAVRKRFP